MNSTLTYGTGLNKSVMTPALTTSGATAGALLRAGAPASAHPSAVASCSAAPVMTWFRLHEEIRGAASGSASAIDAGAALAGIAFPLSPNADAQLRASVRWSDDL